MLSEEDQNRNKSKEQGEANGKEEAIAMEVDLAGPSAAKEEGEEGEEGRVRARALAVKRVFEAVNYLARHR